MLEASGITAGYGERMIVHEVSVRASTREIVAIIGPNGAGKSTLLKAIFGLVRVNHGKVILGGRDITNREPEVNVAAGLSYVPQGSPLFRSLSVRENLDVGGYTLASRAQVEERREEIYELFPALRARARVPAAHLSTGEAQMLSLGRALMLRPRVLLLDEPSLGLAPRMAESALDTVRGLNDKLGATVLIVEQNVAQVLAISSRTYVLRAGRVVLEASSTGLTDPEALREAFLG
jgi:branched-chain amino acid transport system ATP-binding protein